MSDPMIDAGVIRGILAQAQEYANEIGEGVVLNCPEYVPVETCLARVLVDLINRAVLGADKTEYMQRKLEELEEEIFHTYE